MAERDRIARYFSPLTAGENGAFALTDDAAILTPPAGHALVVTTDSVIAGIHVLADAGPQHYAQKLVRRNLSDLAAMGAMPWRYTLNLHTPVGLDDAWFAAFAATLAEEQKTFRMLLVGGDSTSGSTPIHTTLTCFGLAPGGRSLRRAGAMAGDDIYVSGTIGDAALALQLLQHHTPVDAALAARYHCPEPRISLGLQLHGIAHAAIDISDGLMADLAQLCAASAVGATIERAAIPTSAALQQYMLQDASGWNWVLGGGDDYELLFTAAPAMRAQIDALSETLSIAVTRMGTVTSEPVLRVLDVDGAAIPTHARGWEHG